MDPREEYVRYHRDLVDYDQSALPQKNPAGRPARFVEILHDLASFAIHSNLEE